MATKRKSTKKSEEKTPKMEVKPEEIVLEEATTPIEAPKETKITKTTKKSTKSAKIEPKFNIGDIVYIAKDADADLNGFKLFPQYKKYTYTVEAYDADTDIYLLRRANLLLKLKSELILAPNERAHDSLNRKQF